MMYGESCPNCGHVSYTSWTICDCTWSEKLEAANIKKRERRRRQAKEGRPVLVDHLNKEKP